MLEVITFIKKLFGDQDFTPLHAPVFQGNEKKYLNECIDSSFVSSVGKFVDQFEANFASYVGSKYAVATVNGTAALHIALKLAGVEREDEVLTQPLTFIATANAISYCGAEPIFVDVDRETLGLSPHFVKEFLEEHAYLEAGKCINKNTGRRIKACVPMHTFGHPCRIEEIKAICDSWNIVLVEDSAESLGSYYKGKHTGTFGTFGIFSFNGNKVVTSGGGGVIVTDDEALAKLAKHITTTAKKPHPYEFNHDQVGYNYRMPNINAALLVAQLEQIEGFLKSKRELASIYKDYFYTKNIKWLEEPKDCRSNYWLQALVLNTPEERDLFLKESNSMGLMTRPIWKLMNELDMFKHCQSTSLINSKWLEERVVNIPSSVRL